MNSKSPAPSTPAEGDPTVVATIPVHISYEIIRLFSEGLYQSPHKAIEELVSNGYDAGATQVHVLLPEQAEDPRADLEPLWVIDNGHGMDVKGFRQLWRVADSNKTSIVGTEVDRAPIGQFGIGKLAAYVLAWRLLHVSKVDGSILMTEMNFRRVTGKHQFDGAEPVQLSLKRLTEEAAKEILKGVKARDPVAWEFMFGKEACSSWTAAGLSDFKNLYSQLSTGTLRWVLSTGLPLHSDFAIWVNNQSLTSSKERLQPIFELSVGGENDVAAERLGLGLAPTGGVLIPGLDEPIRGRAQIFERRLTHGKSDQYGRSHGFFIRVRGRVINLEDELFGLDVLNHSAWSRFSMEVEADGLREHLLSSREGVRESEPIRLLRKYLHQVFNICRSKYSDWADREMTGLDIELLLADAPSIFVTEPLFEGVREAAASQSDSFYVVAPEFEEDTEKDRWLKEYAEAITVAPFQEVRFEKSGPRDRALRYLPQSRALLINVEHPFIDKLISGGRNRGPATLFGSSEVMVDVLLRDHGVPPSVVTDFLADRDRVLRLIAGEQSSTAGEILRLLSVANQNEKALERAVGAAFRVLGFEYERRGGNAAGADGVLYARLGRDSNELADYKLVYDAKQTNRPSVDADKIDLDSIEDFRLSERADFSFFIADAYAAEEDPTGKLNRKTIQSKKAVSLLKIDHLKRIVTLHYRYGVPLTRLRSLFEVAHTVPEVESWVSELERELEELEPQVPLRVLLDAIEDAKRDPKARPNVYTARATTPLLKEFTPEKLISALQALEELIGRRWLEVEKSGDVRLHHNAEQILTEVERTLRDLFGKGINPTRPPKVS